MNDNRLKGIAVILFGILLSASGEEMNRTVLASFSDFPFALIGIIVGIVGLIMVFKNNKQYNTYKAAIISTEKTISVILFFIHSPLNNLRVVILYYFWNWQIGR